MDNLKSMEDAKRYARLLKNFYGELYTYILTNAALVFVWFVFLGSGHFWPIWIILIWGASLFIKASKLHIIDHAIYKECDTLRERFLFMKKDWEERKVEQLVRRAKENGLFDDAKETNTKASLKNSPTEQKPKAVVKKSAKPATKKVPAKKPAAKKSPKAEA